MKKAIKKYLWSIALIIMILISLKELSNYPKISHICVDIGSGGIACGWEAVAMNILIIIFGSYMLFHEVKKIIKQEKGI